MSRLICLGYVLIGAIFAFLFAVDVTAQSKPPYKIGVILPLSGQTASLGHFLKNGVDLAYSELSSDLQKRISLFYEDDQFQSANSVSAFHRLLSTKSIDAALVLGSGTGNALAPIAEQKRIILIAIGASDPEVSKGRSYIFMHWVTPERESVELVNEIVRRGYQHVALLFAEQKGAIACRDAVVEEFDRRGLKERIVLDERFLPDATDYRTFILKAKARSVDLVVVAVFPGALSSFAKQARAMQLKADLGGMETFEDEHEVKASEGALIGQWYVNTEVAEDSFVRSYKSRYNEHPGWGAANAYDSLKLIAEGVSRFGSDNEKIAGYLSTLRDYPGAAGKYTASGDNRFSIPATVKMVTANGFEKLPR